MEDLEKLPYVNAVLAESLRMYPQPPILIRRALADDTLPSCLNGVPDGYPIGKGADIFISVWNLHRCADPALSARRAQSYSRAHGCTFAALAEMALFVLVAQFDPFLPNA